jgi:hypothetical protein
VASVDWSVRDDASYASVSISRSAAARVNSSSRSASCSDRGVPWGEGSGFRICRSRLVSSVVQPPVPAPSGRESVPGNGAQDENQV